MTVPAPRIHLPHPLVLLTGCVLLAAAASFVLPAGEYDRQEDAGTGRTVVVAGSFHSVEARPVGLFRAFVALPRGMVDAADVVFLVFLVGGAFAVVDQTGTLRRGVGWLAARLGDRRTWVIPILSLAFATGGVLENMHEEIIALIPVLLILTRRLGFDPVVALGMSVGPAVVGSAFSPINPFQVGIAQSLAELPLLSGATFRLVFLALALALWIAATMRFAASTQVELAEVAARAEDPATRRDVGLLALVAATFGVLVWGILDQGWGFDEMSGLFFVMGVAAGILGGLRIKGTAEAYVRGFRDMALAALLIGFARAIYVVLDDGHIVDTIVHGLFMPLDGLSPFASALGMMAAHTAIHIPVPSVSGQAVLTMPVLVPLSDLLGVSRQVTVLAYQFGAGLSDMWVPTNGALLAMLAAAGVRYESWLRFAMPLYGSLMVLGAVSLGVALAIGL